LRYFNENHAHALRCKSYINCSL